MCEGKAGGEGVRLIVAGGMSTDESNQETAELDGEGEGVCGVRVRPSRPSLRSVRLFAGFATLFMVLTIFAVLPRGAAADTNPSSSGLGLLTNVTRYGSGVAVTPTSNGTVLVSDLATFTRWDGVTEPYTELNFSAGDWPYLVRETASSFTASRGAYSLTQGKIPGATYSYEPDRIEETIRINESFPTPVSDPSIFVPFASTYFSLVNGSSVSLYDSTGAQVWTTAPFPAWDSAARPAEWANVVTSVQNAPGGLSLVLNATIAAAATYPLTIDPSWVLGGSVGWGASSFANATTDVGDGSVKIGAFVDNFNNNAAAGWTTSGTVTFASGTMTLSAGSSAFHTASWTNFNTQADVYFASYQSGSGEALFLDLGVTSPGSSGIFLEVLQSSGTVSMSDTISGWQASFTTTISTRTWYTVRVSAQGTTYQVYWNGVLMLTSTDSRARPTGGIDFDTQTLPAPISVDNVRVWMTSIGTITSPVRNAGTSVPTQTELFGTVDTYNQMNILVRSSPNNSTWGVWTNLKANVATGIPYTPANQTQQQYYQLQVILTTGVNGTPVLTQITTTEGPPSISPSANTGYEPWYPYVGGMVNLVTGNLYVTAADLTFQGKGFSLGVTRAYNSFLASTAGPFGLGWTFNYGQTLTINSNGNISWNGPDGSQFLFVAKGATGGFDSPRGVPDRLVKNSDGTFTLWMLDGSGEKFSSAGLLQTVMDRNGNSLTLAYTGSHTLLLSTVTDGAGRSLAFAYDASNRITSVTDPANRQVTYTYYPSTNELEYTTNPMGNKTFYGYTPGQILSQIRDPVGKQLQVSYGTGGQVSSLYLQNVTSNGAVVWQFRADTIVYNTTTLHSVQDARGLWTTVTLNALGNPILITGPPIGCTCDGGGNSSSYVWDGEMSRIQTTDGRHNSWSRTYGVRSNLLSTTDPGGNVSSETWSETNNATNYFLVRTSATTFRRFTTTYAYDTKGNLLSTTDPGGNRTVYAYDASGFLNKTVSARGFTTWFLYNASGYLVKTVDSLSDVTQYVYDILGRMTSSTDPLGALTTTVYDKNGRVTKVTYPLGNFTTNQYDARGDVLQSTDPDGATTAMTYNVTNGRVWTLKDPGGNSTRNAYDPRGNLNATTDTNLHTTYYEYDAFERLTKVTTPLSFVTKYVYDAGGDRIARTDGNSATTRYVFDKLSRLNETKYPGPPVYPSPQTLYYRYDADGNLVSAIGFGYTETRSYDRSDRLMSTNFLYGSFSAPLAYTYDRDGNRATMKDSSGNTTTYFYDAVDRMTGVLDPMGHNTTFSYDRDSRQVAMRQFNGISQAWAYDAAGRLVNLYTNRSSGNLEKITYSFDKMGLRTAEMDVVTFVQGIANSCSLGQAVDACSSDDGPSGISSPQTVTVTVAATGGFAGNPGDTDSAYYYYVKNGVFTLIGTKTATLNSHGIGIASATFSASVTLHNGDTLYGAITDSCGGCASFSVLTISYAASRPAVTVSYDKQHRQYQTIQGTTTTTDTHDAVGNIATETISSAETYTYDANNELTKASFSPTIYVQYTYDRNGNRISSYVPGRGTQETWSYDYENRLIATNYPCTYTYSPTGERVSSNCGSAAEYGYDYGSPGGTPNLKAQYTTSGGVQDQYVQGNGVDTPLELTQGPNTYAYEVDGLGSVNRLTSSGGATAETYTYDAWGAPTGSGSVSNTLQYASREYDPTSGAYYDRARFYDPSADGGHRFLSQDPMGGGYAYVSDSPMNFIDPTGMMRYGGAGGRGGGDGLGGGTESGGSPPGSPPPAQEPWLDRCGFDVGLTIFAAIISLIGINLEGANLANAVVQTLGTWGPDMYGLFHASGAVGFIIAMAQFLWDFFTQIFENVIKVLIQSFWDLLTALFNISTDFVPGALMIRLGIWMVSQYFAIGSLAAENCL